jgi:hypothetical protein
MQAPIERPPRYLTSNRALYLSHPLLNDTLVALDSVKNSVDMSSNDWLIEHLYSTNGGINLRTHL